MSTFRPIGQAKKFSCRSYEIDATDLQNNFHAVVLFSYAPKGYESVNKMVSHNLRIFSIPLEVEVNDSSHKSTPPMQAANGKLGSVGRAAAIYGANNKRNETDRLLTDVRSVHILALISSHLISAHMTSFNLNETGLNRSEYPVLPSSQMHQGAGRSDSLRSDWSQPRRTRSLYGARIELKWSVHITACNLISPHLTSSRLTSFHLNWVAQLSPSAPRSDSVRRGCGQSERSAQPTLF